MRVEVFKRVLSESNESNALTVYSSSFKEFYEVLKRLDIPKRILNE